MEVYRLLRIRKKTGLFLFFPFLLWCSLGCTHRKPEKTLTKTIQTPQEIVPVKDSIVPPILYKNAVSLSKLSLSERKQKFVDLLLPAILEANHHRKVMFHRLQQLSQSKTISIQDSLFIEKLKKKYKAKNFNDLLLRTRPFPVSITLSQAAIESGWGTSRFFLKANNPFGLWSFNKNEKRIKSSSHRSGKYIYLKKFDNLEAAIEAYYDMMATVNVFKAFRKKNADTMDPYALTKTLTAYSERGTAYVNDVIKVLKKNRFTQYDHYTIAPEITE